MRVAGRGSTLAAATGQMGPDAARPYRFFFWVVLSSLRSRLARPSSHGDADKLVPLDKNSQVLRDRYQALGGPVT